MDSRPQENHREIETCRECIMCSQYPGPEEMKECGLLRWSLRVLSVSELETLQPLRLWEQSLWQENSTETLFSFSTWQSLPTAKEKGNIVFTHVVSTWVDKCLGQKRGNLKMREHFCFSSQFFFPCTSINPTLEALQGGCSCYFGQQMTTESWSPELGLCFCCHRSPQT